MSLFADLRERRGEILRFAARCGARTVRVFGSVARDEETPESALARFEPGRSLPVTSLRTCKTCPAVRSAW